ncbi:hypothetical protein ABPG77_002937, partial [Micractinium sp. CCAP 211/92]
MNLNTARKALRESRTISLRRSLEASTVSPNISLDMDARASAAQEAVDAVDSTDLESALLLPRQQGNPQGSAGAPPGGSPRLGAEASGDCERQSSARSLTGPEYQAHRDSRALWRLARTNLGLSVREEADGHMRVVRTSVGTALQPSPSWQRASEAPNEQNVKSIADSFVALLAGKGLGTGMALRSNSSLLRGRSAPGMFAPRTDAKAVWHMLTSSFLNIMLIALPLNFLALIPLALFLGEVTEDLAVRFGDTVGGLLNATFGNVVELILSVAALQRGLYTVVATSLIGSILSNLLLVL